MAASRDRLLVATLRVLADKGYDDLTVRDVAALADTGTSSIYHFFGNKEELCRATLEHFDALVREERNALGPEDGSPLERLEQLITWLQNTGDYHWRGYYDTAMARSTALGITPSAVESQMDFPDQMAEIVLAAAERGDLVAPDGYSPEELASMITDGVLGIVARNVMGPSTTPLDRSVPLFLLAVLEAFGPEGASRAGSKRSPAVTVTAS